MKKILKRTLATVLTAVILFGAVPFGPFNLSTKADAVNISSPSLNTTEQLFKDFIINKDYLDFELTAFDIWYDQDLTNLEYKFFVYDFDLDSDKELIMQTSVYYHQDFAFFKVKNNEVIMIDDTALYKGGFDSLIKNSKYNGLVCHCGVGMYCEYYDINGAQQFERTNYNGKISYENYNMDNDLYEILSDEYLDSNGNFVNDNLIPILWYSPDEIEAMGWNEFFKPSWSRAYYDYFCSGDYIEYFIGGNDLSASNNDPKGPKFGLKDMNNDGIPELLISDPWQTGTNGHGWIFSYVNGNVEFVGYSDSYGGMWNPHMISTEKYSGFFTYVWYREQNHQNEMPFHLIYYSFDGEKIISEDVCADYSKSGEYDRITNDVELYNAVTNANREYRLNYIEKYQLVYESEVEEYSHLKYNWGKFILLFSDYLGDYNDIPDFTQDFWIDGVPGNVTLNFKNSWFDNDSTNYNHELCQFAAKFSMLGYDSSTDKSCLVEALTKCEFNSIEKDFNTDIYDVNYFFATQKIQTAIKEYNLIFAGFIGTNEDQWKTDFYPGYNEDGSNVNFHEGFLYASTKAEKNLNNYIKKYASVYNFNKDNTILLITGHSRGAAVSNLLSARLIDKESFAIKENIFTYTFATPNTTTLTNKYDEKYLRIFNIVNPEDIVTKFMPIAWEFGRYGRTFTLPSKTNCEQYNSFVKNMQTEFKKYKNRECGTMNGGELLPFTFVSYITNKIHSAYEYCTTKHKLVGEDFSVCDFMCTFVAPILKNIGDIEQVKLLLGTLISEKTDDFYKSLGKDLTVITARYGINEVLKFNDAHIMETYCAWLCSLEQSQIVGNHKLSEGNCYGEYGCYLGIANCPVDVEVYNKNTGELVGRITNNTVDESILTKDDSIVMNVKGDSKLFFLPLDGNYDIKLIGNDNGKMDYTLSEINSDIGEIGRVNFFDVVITDGKAWTGVTASDNFNIDEYMLKSDDGNIIKPTEQKDDVKSVKINTTVNGNGTVSESLSVTSGDYVTLTATPNKNYEFIGWYKSDKLVSTDMTYSFVAKEDITFIAKFTEYALGDVNADENINSSDALLILQHSVGQITLTGDKFTRADVTKDKTVNSSDALKILQYSVGQINKF